MMWMGRWSGLSAGLFVGLVVLSGCGQSVEAPDGGRDDGGGSVLCARDDQCDDDRHCNGSESCDPSDAEADALGCVPGAIPCGAGEVCDELEDRCRPASECPEPDADGDGHAALACGGDDCDDTDAARFPGQPEVCDPGGHDEDCDPFTFGARDLDGDGAADARCCDASGSDAPICGSDCDDDAAAVGPGSGEICDGLDNDCDDRADEGVARSFYRDADGDAFGDELVEVTGVCAAPDGFVDTRGDCDDTAAARNPGAPEVCDGLDNDCDATVDEGTTVVPYYVDADGDGWGSAAAATIQSCTPVAGRVAMGGDCDDAVPSRNPSAPETCDELDNDCDGMVDEATVSVDWYLDSDGDGWGNEGIAPIRSCDPQDGRVPLGGDCDDTLAGRNPGAPEVCDARDNDCDLTVDEGVRQTYFRDQDGDNFGATDATVEACAPPEGYVLGGNDCDDQRAGRNPGNAEACDLVPDNDCDDASSPFDIDRDGHDAAGCGGDDCNDANAAVFPGAVELCDGWDNRCLVDGRRLASEDGDGDGYALDGTDCAGGPLRFGDCDDTRAEAHPDALERCNGLDDDCDELSDEEPAATAACATPGTIADCTDGACTILGCEIPWANCDGAAQNGCEANLQNDVATCGSCATACDVGATCDAGSCSCPPMAPSTCGSRCVNLTQDVLDCGSCGNRCPGGASCVLGVCACPMGRAVCGGECVDLSSDTRHCGACGDSCFGGSCAGGSCMCAGAMPAVCDGRCEDVVDDPVNCGACGATCFGGSCAGGTCSCGVDETYCDGYCIDTASDPLNCGGCGRTCLPGAACLSSSCTPSVGWRRTVGAGDEGREDGAFAVAVAPSGEVTFLVQFNRMVDFGGGGVTALGNPDVAVVRYAADGAHLFTTVIADANETLAGDLVAIGEDVFAVVVDESTVDRPRVVRVSSAGAITWQVDVGIAGQFVPPSRPRIPHLAVTPSGDAVLAMAFEGSGDPGTGTLTSAGTVDLALLGMDGADGSVQWADRFGGLGWDWAADFAVDSSTGELYILGAFEETVDFGGGSVSANGPNDAFVLALAADRSFRWLRVLGGPGEEIPRALALDGARLAVTVQAQSGGTLAGVALDATESVVAQYGTGGALEWARPLGVAFLHDIVYDAGGAGDLHLTSGGRGLLTPGDQGLFVGRLDASDGSQLEGVLVATRFSDGRALAIGPDGERYVAGTFRGIVTFHDDGAVIGASGTDAVMFQLR